MTSRVRRRWLLPILVLTLGPAARGQTVATVINDSPFTVQLLLKWSHVPFESPMITLQPQDLVHQVGPPGANLYIRFNATPGRGPFEKSYRVVTASGVSPQSWGAVSFFRPSQYNSVDLVLAPYQPFLPPQTGPIAPPPGPPSGPPPPPIASLPGEPPSSSPRLLRPAESPLRPVERIVDWRDVGAAGGAGVGSYYGGQAGGLVGGGVGRIVGGGMPEINRLFGGR
jgi:hypothetical protein